MPATRARLAPDSPRAISERELLLRLAEGPVSGDRLARELGLTRAAIWSRGVEISADDIRSVLLPLTTEATSPFQRSIALMSMWSGCLTPTFVVR